MNNQAANPEQGMAFFDVEEIINSPFRNDELKPYLATVMREHHLKGNVIVQNNDILFLVKYSEDDPKKIKSDLSSALIFGWDGTFGSALTLTFYERKKDKVVISGRAYISNEHECFDLISPNKNFYIGFVKDFKLKNTLKLIYKEEKFKRGIEVAIERVRLKPAEEQNINLHYWELFSLTPSWDKVLSARDQLKIGWSKHYQAEFRHLKMLHENEYKNYKIHKEAICSKIDDKFSKVFELFFEDNLSKAINYFNDYLNIKGFMNEVLSCVHIISSEFPNSNLYYVPGALFKIAVDSPENTSCGDRVSYIDGNSGTVNYQLIDSQEWDSTMALNFWALVESAGVRCDRDITLNSNDYPIRIEDETKVFNEVGLDISIDEAELTISNLLEESTSNKKWTIPPKAFVQIKFGPFISVELSEVGKEVYCVWRLSNDHYFLMSVNPYNLEWYLDFKNEGNSEKVAEIKIAFKLIIAAMIRDFWIVEERRDVFARQIDHKFRASKNSNRKARIIYLPRIIYNRVPNIKDCVQELELNERSKHSVRAHLRKTEKASDAQIQLAKLYGLKVSSGYTFVRPHERGNVESEVIYRSKSALQLLYSADTNISSNIRSPDWFEFEKDVAELLQKNDFNIIKRARKGYGDEGIDILAERKNKKEIEVWIIQCKCYSDKIGPSVVRELAGTIALYQGQARGLLVTTSSFTNDATTTAKTANILLMDGRKFIDSLNGNFTI